MKFHTPWRNRKENWGPFSVRTVSGGPYTDIQSRPNAEETSVAVMPASETTCTTFKNQSTTIRRKMRPVDVSVTGPRMSNDTLATGSVAGNNLNIFVLDCEALRRFHLRFADG